VACARTPIEEVFMKLRACAPARLLLVPCAACAGRPDEPAPMTAEWMLSDPFANRAESADGRRPGPGGPAF